MNGSSDFSSIVIVGANPIARAIAASSTDFFVSSDVEVVPMEQAGESALAISAADLVILAEEFSDAASLTHVLGFVRDECVITDTGATKRPLLDALKESGLVQRFVGSHVLGPSAGAPATLRGSSVYVHVTPEAPMHLVARIGAFWESVGTRTIYVHPARHAELMTNLAHLPRLLAVAQLELLRRSGEDLNLLRVLWSPHLRDSTRPAILSTTSWAALVNLHRESLAEGLRRTADMLYTISDTLEAGDEASTVELLRDVSDMRRRLE